MNLHFRVEVEPHSFEAEDAILNALNDVGLRSDVEAELSTAIANIMRWRDICVAARLLEWV